jgi:hypothetical protein
MSASQQYAPKGTPKLYLNKKHLADLAESGITPETAQAEKVFSMPASLSKEILGRPLGTGLCFQFGEGFWRVKLDRKQKDDKQYRQRGGTVNRIYIPWSLPDRDRVRSDPTIPLITTEGEKKAIKAVQEGLVAVALTGVHAFLHKGEPIPDLDTIAWEGRQVTIVFDSDPGERSKGQVDKARRWLAAELTIRGAHVNAVILPDDGQTKVGLDDYLLTHAIEEFLALPRQSVQLYSPIINQKGRERKYSITPEIEKLISIMLSQKSDSDFWAPFRSILNHGHKSNHLTRFVRYRGETRVQVGVLRESSYAWPLAVVYYNLLRRRMQPKGRYTMVKVFPSTFMSEWQGRMEVAAGVLTVPDEYRVTSLEGLRLNPSAVDVMNDWLLTSWLRHRAYPGCPAAFNAGNTALALGRDWKAVRADWEALEFFEHVDGQEIEGPNGKTRTLYTRGTGPTWQVRPWDDREVFDLENHEKSETDFEHDLEAKSVVNNEGYEGFLHSPLLINSGERSSEQLEVRS